MERKPQVHQLQQWYWALSQPGKMHTRHASKPERNLAACHQWRSLHLQYGQESAKDPFPAKQANTFQSGIHKQQWSDGAATIKKRNDICSNLWRRPEHHRKGKTSCKRPEIFNTNYRKRYDVWRDTQHVRGRTRHDMARIRTLPDEIQSPKGIVHQLFRESFQGRFLLLRSQAPVCLRKQDPVLWYHARHIANQWTDGKKK